MTTAATAILLFYSERPKSNALVSAQWQVGPKASHALPPLFLIVLDYGAIHTFSPIEGSFVLPKRSFKSDNHQAKKDTNQFHAVPTPQAQFIRPIV